MRKHTVCRTSEMTNVYPSRHVSASQCCLLGVRVHPYLKTLYSNMDYACEFHNPPVNPTVNTSFQIDKICAFSIVCHCKKDSNIRTIQDVTKYYLV
jgi:hypothetical protein